MAAKKCLSCEIRNVGTGPDSSFETREQARILDLCLPCLDKGSWENVHSDYGHDENGPEAPASGQYEAGHRVEGCWACYPELDKSGAEYVAKSGTSRKGMRMTVPVRGSSYEKAMAVATALADRWAGNVGPGPRKDGTASWTLAYAGDTSAVLQWDARGRFVYGLSTITINGRVIRPRNAAAAIRLLSGQDK